MIVTGLLFVSTAAYTGAKAYQKQRRLGKLLARESGLHGKRHPPRSHGLLLTTICDETIEGMQALEPRDLIPAPWAVIGPSAWFRDAREAIERLDYRRFAALFGGLRRHQFRMIFAAENGSEVSPEERDINRHIVTGFGLLSLFTVASLGYSLLTFIAVPFLLLDSIPVALMAIEDMGERRKLGVNAVDAITMNGVLVLGYFWLAGLANIMYWANAKLLLKVQNHSRQRLADVFGEQPRTVWLQRGDLEIEIPFEDIQAGDIVVAHAGEAVPVDGVITAGVGSIDQHVLTGESQPVEKGVGESVLASTIMLSGRICIAVEQAGAETIVANIGELLNRTADYTSTLELKGLALADQSVLPTVAIGAVTGALLGPTAGLCALGCYVGYNMKIIAPLSLLNFLNIASRHNIMIKDGRALESLKKIDTVVFDKTGTLTREQPHVAVVYPYGLYSEDEVLRYAAAAEAKQSHPIARAIAQEAGERELVVPPFRDASYEIGYGLKGEVEARQIRVGSARFMEREEIVIPPDIKALQEACNQRGYSLIYVAIDDAIGGVIELRATIRREARQIVAGLRQRNLEMIIISGDHEHPTQQLATAVGIDHYVAETLPEHKADLIAQLQAEGKSVCFVGDGINDAIALQQAHVSVSLRGASTIATDTADIILMDESLTQLVRVFELADDLDVNMKNNLIATILPAPFLLGSIYLLNFRLMATLIFASVASTAGVVNAMLPAIKSRRDETLKLPVASP